MIQLLIHFQVLVIKIGNLIYLPTKQLEKYIVIITIHEKVQNSNVSQIN